MANGNNNSNGGSNDLHGVNGGNHNHPVPEMNANDPLIVEEDVVLGTSVQNNVANSEVNDIPNTPDPIPIDNNETQEAPQVEIPTQVETSTSIPTQSSKPSIPNFTRWNIVGVLVSGARKEFKDVLVRTLFQAEPEILKVLVEAFRPIVDAEFVKQSL
ncbi:Armadillo-like helical [Artemisia annua]|uniref:Armadillo-like helical n=1 Tax=Artemisia annua TaxID=35608 RepID=A0A2U1NDX5_ARTAN|nr:Armadillo-like helical [Artemisia annua]